MNLTYFYGSLVVDRISMKNALKKHSIYKLYKCLAFYIVKYVFDPQAKYKIDLGIVSCSWCCCDHLVCLQRRRDFGPS